MKRFCIHVEDLSLWAPRYQVIPNGCAIFKGERSRAEKVCEADRALVKEHLSVNRINHGDDIVPRGGGTSYV